MEDYRLMNTTLRRERVTTRVKNTHVESDGRTVWVNRLCRCIARFCPISREYNLHWNTPQMVRHSKAEPTLEDWESFVAVMEESFEIKIDPKHRPLYIQDPAT